MAIVKQKPIMGSEGGDPSGVQGKALVSGSVGKTVVSRFIWDGNSETFSHIFTAHAQKQLF